MAGFEINYGPRKDGMCEIYLWSGGIRHVEIGTILFDRARTGRTRTRTRITGAEAQFSVAGPWTAEWQTPRANIRRVYVTREPRESIARMRSRLEAKILETILQDRGLKGVPLEEMLRQAEDFVNEAGDQGVPYAEFVDMFDRHDVSEGTAELVLDMSTSYGQTYYDEGSGRIFGISYAQALIERALSA